MIVIDNLDELIDWVDQNTGRRLQPGFVSRIARELNDLANNYGVGWHEDWSTLLDGMAAIFALIEPTAHWERKT